MATETSTKNKPSPTIQDGEGNLSHVYCQCDETVALCGWDLTQADDIWDENNVCFVCEELDFSDTYVCPKCNQ